MLHRIVAIFIGLFLYLGLIPSSLGALPCGSVVSDLNQNFVLDTGWKLRVGDNLDWKHPDTDESFWSPRNLPDYNSNKTETLSGYFWYRCKFLLSESTELRISPWVLALGKVREMDETYLNGHLIGKTGSLLPKWEPDFHQDRIYTIPSHLLQPGENTIAIRVYSSIPLRGFRQAPFLGEEDSVRVSHSLGEIFPITSGYLLILMGAYFLVGTFYRGRVGENLFFSLFSVSLGVYTLLRSQHRYVLFDSFTTSYNVELLLLLPLPSFFLNFLYFYLNRKRTKILLGYEIYLGLLAIVLLIFKDGKIWNYIIQAFNYSLPIAIYLTVEVSVRNFEENKKRMKYILFGFLALVPTILIDSFTALDIWNLPGTIYMGFLFFLLMISLELTGELVRGIQRQELLERELMVMEKEKTNFLINVSGKFRYYLKLIESNLLLLKQAKAKKNLKIVFFQTETVIQSLLDNLNDASLIKKLEKKSYIEKWETLAPLELIESVKNEVEAIHNQKRKATTINPTGGLETISTDRHLISRLLFHLIENAYLFTEHSTKISLEISAYGSGWKLTVEDEGPGLSSEDLNKIQSKFVRMESAHYKKEIPGAGIGLSLVRSIADFFQAKMEIKSREGMGTKVEVIFPQGAER